MGTRCWTLRVRFAGDAERHGLDAHAERGNDQTFRSAFQPSGSFAGKPAPTVDRVPLWEWACPRRRQRIHQRT
ncbi:hypothetical protein CCU68_34715 [Pseudomonas gingeri NCPPB 3146 = LMG 5327]|uniref:DUF1534 domain-containing protein n=1 Tax=Pseudomonas gingeri NCPPB 3146 = LMG 5327 TaxID=707248 RepID=A0ABX4XS89_9PSED|nr:hypothetical protein CCU68_34715 [Pseudomonas gingeri NCPPB 3146 = LMG 5327]